MLNPWCGNMCWWGGLLLWCGLVARGTASSCTWDHVSCAWDYMYCAWGLVVLRLGPPCLAHGTASCTACLAHGATCLALGTVSSCSWDRLVLRIGVTAHNNSSAPHGVAVPERPAGCRPATWAGRPADPYVCVPNRSPSQAGLAGCRPACVACRLPAGPESGSGDITAARKPASYRV